jgi:hypothetical protein
LTLTFRPWVVVDDGDHDARPLPVEWIEVGPPGERVEADTVRLELNESGSLGGLVRVCRARAATTSRRSIWKPRRLWSESLLPRLQSRRRGRLDQVECSNSTLPHPPRLRAESSRPHSGGSDDPNISCDSTRIVGTANLPAAGPMA